MSKRICFAMQNEFLVTKRIWRIRKSILSVMKNELFVRNWIRFAIKNELLMRKRIRFVMKNELLVRKRIRFLMQMEILIREWIRFLIQMALSVTEINLSETDNNLGQEDPLISFIKITTSRNNYQLARIFCRYDPGGMPVCWRKTREKWCRS